MIYDNHIIVLHSKYIEILSKNISKPSFYMDSVMGLKYYDKFLDDEKMYYIFEIKDHVKLALAKLKYEF